MRGVYRGLYWGQWQFNKKLMAVTVALVAVVVVGKRQLALRLCGVLQVRIKKTRQIWDWHFPLTFAQNLKQAAKGYLREAGV